MPGHSFAAKPGETISQNLKGKPMRLVILAVFAVLSVLPVKAEPLSSSEQALLDKTRTQFVDALRDQDYDVIVSVIPPKVLEHIATSAGATSEQLLAELPKVMKQTMTGVTFGRADIATENLDASKSVLEGKEYAWGFAPSTFEMTINGQNWRSVGHTLALQEDGKWYLVRTSEAEKVKILRAIYPFFASVDFPAETTGPMN